VIPERLQYLLRDETKAYLHLATVMRDGTPQITIVWFNYDGTHVLVNSSRGRVKDRNMRRRPDVAALIADPNDPYRYLQIRGPVVDITEEGADEHIRELALKYRGRREYSVADQRRVIYRILPEHVSPAR